MPTGSLSPHLALPVLLLASPAALAQLPCAGKSGEILQGGSYLYPSYATSVALDGDVLLVGHPGYGQAYVGPFYFPPKGAAEVFRFQGGAWQLEALLQPEQAFVPALGVGAPLPSSDAPASTHTGPSVRDPSVQRRLDG